MIQKMIEEIRLDIILGKATLVDQLAHADMLVDAGELKLAHAYRWMAHQAKRPHHRAYYRHFSNVTRMVENTSRVPAKYSWAWYPSWLPSPIKSQEMVNDCSILPRLVFLSMAGRSGGNRVNLLYPSFTDAVVDLAAGLEQLASHYDCQGRSPYQ